MKCLIKANTIYENMYPLTKDTPAGLLSVGGRPVVDWLLEDLESSGEVTEYLIVVCGQHRTNVRNWKEGQAFRDKIKLLSEEEAAEIADSSDMLTLPAEMITAFSIGEALKEGKDVKRLLSEEAAILVNSLPKYEDLNHRRFLPRIHDKFQIEAFTQERYGDIFISKIQMVKQIQCGESGMAKIRLHNLSDGPLTPENTTVRYRLWREQTYKDRFEVDKILTPQAPEIPLPVTLPAGEAAELSVEICAPGRPGKYYLKIDLKKDDDWLEGENAYLLFPSVSFIAELHHDISEGELLSRPKVILAGTPESSNAGEQLEAVAIREFMERHFPTYKIMEYTARRLEEFWQLEGVICNEKDIIVPYGSGFMGLPEKMGEEHLRRRTAAAASLPEIWLRFFSMPQHIAFSETQEGKKEIEDSATAYGRNHYYLAGASEADYQFLKRYFKKSRISKAPLLSFGKAAREDREPRGDDFTVVAYGEGREGFLDTVYQAIDSNGYHRMYLNLDYNAYQSSAWFGERSRSCLIDFCCDIIQDTRAVVTDTFYGLAYALICRRPCVVYQQSQDAEWFAERDDVIFVEKPEEIEEACKQILLKKGKGPLDGVHYQPFIEFLLT